MTRLFSLSLSVALLSLGCRGEPKEPEETGGADTGDLIDADGDGSPASEDCDDLDAASFPGAEEVCDGVDNDCDGVADENVQSTFYQDADGDGYGNALASVEACEAGVGFADNPHDCNDLDDATHPDTQEVCDGTDNDCDGAIDEPDAADASTWFQDADGDGWGTDNTSTTACNAPVGYVLHGGDCDDADPAFHPGALEADCTDASDYNCDGSVGFEDADSDGYAACEDCDDTLAAVNEAATEVCDSIDNDCDGTADEDDAADAVTWYGDSDGDGHGGTTFQVIACTAPVGYVTSSDDCDDLDASSYPGASESCDTADNDCDGQVDEGVELTFYADADGDGYGDSSQPTQSCTQPPGYSANGDDCNDGEPSARPGGLEICDGLDNDCDGTVDDNALDGSTWYPDADGDGYGDSSGGVSSCAPLSGYIADGTDCDDTSAALSPADGDSDGASSCDGDCDDADATQNLQDADSDGYSTCDGDCLDTDSSANPGATEICDGIDNNCDGVYFEDNEDDVDEDGVPVCDGDCNDNNPTIFPGATELCDGIDNDCDDTVDDGVIRDSDQDGYERLACAGEDCDDGNSSIFPGATENCADSVDNDCDELIDDEDESCVSQQGGCSCEGSLAAADSPGSGLGLLAAAGLLGLLRRRREGIVRL